MPETGNYAAALVCAQLRAGMSFVSISRLVALPIAYGEPYWDNLRELLQDGQVDRFAQSASLWGTLPQDHPEFIRQR